MKPILKYLIGIILLSCNNNKDIVTDNKKPTISLVTKDSVTNNLIYRDTLTASAIVLSKAFAENEVTANKKYKGKLLKVEGIIKQINIGISDKAYVLLNGVDRFTEPFCYLINNEDAEKLKIGYKITLLGECTGLWANLIFKDCKIISTQ